MIGPITCVTIAAPDLGAMEDAYQHLGYRATAGGRISGQLAAFWGAEAVEDAQFLLMAPETSKGLHFRFVEQPATPGYEAYRCYGWNAAELIVQDTDALEQQLIGTPFHILGPPADLSITDAIRAMQVQGPAKEFLYLTMFKRRTEFDVPEAVDFVDRTFIVILGGPNVEMLGEGWGQRFGLTAGEARPVKITVMGQVYGLPSDHRFMLSTMGLSGSNLIELDSMPETATPRPQREGWLPPAISMVSFASDDLGETTLAGQAGAPYHGRRAAMWRGPVDEWVELIAPA
ncbi:hypothetical protein [Candidatus Foliamicus sp.]